MLKPYRQKHKFTNSTQAAPKHDKAATGFDSVSINNEIGSKKMMAAKALIKK